MKYTDPVPSWSEEFVIKATVKLVAEVKEPDGAVQHRPATVFDLEFAANQCGFYLAAMTKEASEAAASAVKSKDWYSVALDRTFEVEELREKVETLTKQIEAMRGCVSVSDEFLEGE